MRSLCLLCLCFSSVLPCLGSDYGKVTTHKVAEGIYLFTTTPYADVGFCGNSIAIISTDGVLVFDSASTPETAQTILAEIRQLTSQPVRYLVNSHWHWDHWGGNQVFLAAFPDIQIITHEKNRQMMLEIEPRWNDHGLKQELPQFIDDLSRQVARGKADHLPEEKIRKAEERLAVDRNFLAQKQSLKKTYPNVTFSDGLTLHMGARKIQILHARAITPGDTYVYLPEEKILITGDILLDPYPYAIGGSYPAEWLATLRKFAAMQPATVIPGHGGPVAGTALVQSNLDLFDSAIRQVREAKTHGSSQDKTLNAIGDRAAELSAKVGVAGGDATQAFRSYFLDIFIKRAYRELDGDLGDLPDGLPGGP